MRGNKTPEPPWLRDQRALIVHSAACAEVEVGRATDGGVTEVHAMAAGEHAVVFAEQPGVVNRTAVSSNLYQSTAHPSL
jgi:hypothetical protein